MVMMQVMITLNLWNRPVFDPGASTARHIDEFNTASPEDA
jgi:hypothetical protein